MRSKGDTFGGNVNEKPQKKAHARPPQFSPAANSSCLCGSGLTFKRCCANRLPGTDIGKRTRRLLADENFGKALEACRADVSQYTIWHRSHTEPAIQRGMPRKGSLLEIDVRALADWIDTLFFCHTKTEKLDEFPAALERLRDNIKDISWQRKITYFHALHALGRDRDESAGRRELKRLGSLVDEDDVETLQLYLDLFGDTLSFSEKQAIIDRILNESEQLSDQLHYTGMRAALYFMIGDHRRADTDLSDILTEVRSKHSDDELSHYDRYRLAMTLDLLGVIRRDNKLFTDAGDLYQSLLKQDGLSPKERAHLLGMIGETHRHRTEWESARSAYEQALETEPSDLHKVFLCECLIQLNQAENAAKMLFGIDPTGLEKAEYIDYAFVLAALAIEIGAHERLEMAKSVLMSVRAQDPYFRERRDNYLLKVQEAMISGTSPSLTKSSRGLLASVTRSISRYLILRPTIMGMGVDVGKVLEDLSKKGDARASPKAVPPQKAG
jgi:tetratricopeptide (TPR) repeat protein